MAHGKDDHIIANKTSLLPAGAGQVEGTLHSGFKLPHPCPSPEGRGVSKNRFPKLGSKDAAIDKMR